MINKGFARFFCTTFQEKINDLGGCCRFPPLPSRTLHFSAIFQENLSLNRKDRAKFVSKTRDFSFILPEKIFDLGGLRHFSGIARFSTDFSMKTRRFGIKNAGTSSSTLDFLSILEEKPLIWQDPTISPQILDFSSLFHEKLLIWEDSPICAKTPPDFSFTFLRGKHVIETLRLY